ncbi:hypothetical protein [Arsukibacterium ikkense]|uniref:hypothetical protein n=1 Tax=Arsukibacterium ikkense TaxID=336831 RepID=UPI00128D3A29|nr:hypothetical protein [Arsukibacterium ikkense]
MNLKLKKTELVNLSMDDKKLPDDLTPQVAGGITITFTVITRHTTEVYCHSRGPCGDGGDWNSFTCGMTL